MTTRVRIKICCIGSVREASTAIAYGASAIGLVGHMPSGPGVIDDQLIFEIARTVPPGVSTFLLTSETRPENIIAHYNKVQTSTIQIVDKLEDNQYGKIRTVLPHVKLVQVIHVIDHHSIEEAIEAAQWTDALLLDSGNPNLAVKELGGTGRTHDWSLSKKIRESVSIPVFLAGGINKNNVRKAIDFVQPFGIDLCSSVRTLGMLDEQKLEEFINEVR
jgi:phosphoribosylanthranilate isomerase